jgi:hypothetical protein
MNQKRTFLYLSLNNTAHDEQNGLPFQLKICGVWQTILKFLSHDNWVNTLYPRTVDITT